jgi:hypothetical protein
LLLSLSERLHALFLNNSVMVNVCAVGVADFLLSLFEPFLLLSSLRRLTEPSPPPTSVHTLFL